MRKGKNMICSPPSRARYLLIFLLFSLLFSITVLGMILLGNHIATSPAPSAPAALQANRPVIIIDAGHGGEDGGAIGVNGCYEKDINLKIAEKLSVFLSLSPSLYLSVVLGLSFSPAPML